MIRNVIAAVACGLVLLGGSSAVSAFPHEETDIDYIKVLPFGGYEVHRKDGSVEEWQKDITGQWSGINHSTGEQKYAKDEDMPTVTRNVDGSYKAEYPNEPAHEWRDYGIGEFRRVP